jgi:outer membrane protein
MRKIAAFFLVLIPLLSGEVRPMTLREAVQTALKQNSDIALARLDEDKARQAVRIANDPFRTRVVVGSGLAYSNGIPMSIEGATPSIFQAQATQYLFNRPQSFVVAQAKENARGASLAVTGKREEVAYKTASLYLDAERAGRIGALAQKDAGSLEKVLETVQAQVREGRALPLAEKQAAFNLARSRALAENLEDDRVAAETALALALGFPAEDRVHPREEERPAPVIPASEQAALAAALRSNKELRRLESDMIAKQLQIKGQKAERWPRVDLVAQYALLGRYNNYDQFYNTFQRNNGQIGMSFQIPVLTGPGARAQVAQTSGDVARLRIEHANARNRIHSDIQASFREVRKAETAAEVARLDLEVAREQLSVNLAQMQEGRISLRQVEEARILENEKWIAFYDTQYSVERAKWNVLRLTGELTASIDALN